MDPISLGVGLISGISSFFGARRARRRARRAARRAAGRQMVLEANRQDIPDFQADMANPYANLQVATQAAEMQAEQADIALASSLDALRATGAGAGGATALARAAAQSKRGVSASIEKQEARNAQLRAQGEMQAAQMRQTGQIAQFRAQEARDDADIQRQAGLGFAAQQQEAAARSAQGSALGAIAGSVATFADAGGFKGLFGGSTPSVSTPMPAQPATQQIGNFNVPTSVSFNPIEVSNTTSLGGVTSFGSQQSTNAFQDIFNQRGFTFNPNQ